MPSTKAHDVITVTTASFGLLTYLRRAADPDWPLAVLLCGSYLLSGLMLSADLDIKSRPYQRWGPLRFIWWPYMKFVPHRSWLSHGLLLGPMLRVAYLCAIFGLPFAFLMWFEGRPWTGGILPAVAAFLKEHIEPVAVILLGIILGGVAHTLADFLGSLVRRLLGLGRLRHLRR